jgi:hypothetical protein
MSRSSVRPRPLAPSQFPWRRIVEITEVQKSKIAEWIDDGASLSEVQRRLSEEFQINMTYMDVRFMLLELGLTPQDREESAQSDPSLLADAAGGQQEPIEASGVVDDGLQKGNVSVDVDRVMKPGSLVSGTVVFSDGVKASWSLDQFGRLALDAGGAEVQPSPEDVKAFQEELRKNLEKRGFSP